MAAREQALLAREAAVQSREDVVAAAEVAMRTAAAMRVTADGHMLMLQQANERLVIATIEAQKLADQLQIAKSQMETAKFVAEKANLAKSDFLSRMSHELRSPLHAVLGFAQLMETASPPPTATQAANIAQILQAGWHLLALIKEILDLSGIGAGKVALALEPVALAEVLAECQDMMEAEAQARGIRMDFRHFDAPTFVWADRVRLKQIFVNLLSNAVKYNVERGTIAVAVTAISRERVRISVTDSGEGLNPEKLAQLFQPFNRLGQETGFVAGTGIGLVVARQLAELMGGTLGVSSIAGAGSVFWVELLTTPTQELEVGGVDPSGATRVPGPVGTPVRTVLYIEDNPSNLELVAQLIARRSDLRLLTAVNGTLGIELARASRPDVILMDMKLPGISGIEALEILREDPTMAHIPVVAVSANAGPKDISRGLAAGFFAYLTKPIAVTEFMDALDATLAFSEKNRRKLT